MPPKGRKSLSSTWYCCEVCGVFITHKDTQQHQTLACPPDAASYEHAFIKDSTLFSFTDKSSINSFPNLSKHDKLTSVFLSQSAMQLCNIQVGEQIAVIFSNGCSEIRTVWPTAEKSLTSVILPSLDQGSKSKFEEGARVKVGKIKGKPVPASNIQLTSQDEVVGDHEQLLSLCKHLYTNKFLALNSEVFVPYYGKNIFFNVKDITPVKDETNDDLVDMLENFGISEDVTRELYFLAVESTKWYFSQNKPNQGNKREEDDISLNSVGGYKEVIEELCATISNSLKRNSLTLSMPSSIGILLYGPNGVGKTFISQAIANSMNCPIIKINSGELFSKFYGETEQRLKAFFDEAKSKSPSIILLDNVDTLCPKRGGTEQERRVVSYLLTLLDSLKYTRTVVIATTAQRNSIDPSLRRPGRLDVEVELPVPSVSDRFDILKGLLSRWKVDDSDLMNVAQMAHGYVAADLQCLVTKAVMQAASQGRSDIIISDVTWALTQVKPSAMREVLVQVPNVKWTDIGGMDDLKLKLKQAIEWPLRHPESFLRLGISPPRGVLMYGPPGCSKTMIAKALATESGLNFLSIKGSELFSKWVGESEKAVQTLFKKARSVAPSIVFLDELDALGGERSGASEGSNVQERVLAQLLTEMDGVEPLGNVNIVAATNRPDRIDKALLRPGRLDRMVYVPLPDLATRLSILQLQVKKMPVSESLSVQHLAELTNGYSGAEVVAVCHEAAINALQEDFNIDEVSEKHFNAALDMIKPRTPQYLLKLYDDYNLKN